METLLLETCLPTLIHEPELSSQLSSTALKHTTSPRWMLSLYGLESLESSLQWDIKAAPRLLLAANCIKEPRSLASHAPSSPTAFALERLL